MGNGVGVTSEVGLSGYAGKLSGKWKHKCGFSFDKVALDGKGVKYEASFAKLTPCTRPSSSPPLSGLTVSLGLTLKATGEVNLNKPLSTVEAQFTKDSIAGSVKSDVSFETTTASVVLGQDGLQVGGAVTYKRKEGGLQDYPLAIGYGDKKYFAAVSAEEKLRKFGLVSDDLNCHQLNHSFCVLCRLHDTRSLTASP